MRVQLTVRSASDDVLQLVNDFARGLGCSTGDAPSAGVRGVQITMSDVEEDLVELLTHVALSATKVGLDIREPLCELTYHHEGVSSEVRLVLRVEQFNIGGAAAV
jgi:hypothetical protein